MLRVRIFFAFFIALALTAAVEVQGQASRPDSAAVLFAAGNDFEAAGEWEVAQAIYQHVIERFAGTPAAALAESRMTLAMRGGIAGAGAVELQVWTTLYGLFLGSVVPLALNAESAEAYGLGILVGGPGGFLIGRGVARNRALTEGQARAITWGGTWGGWQGFGWSMVFDVGSERFCDPSGFCRESDEDAPAVAGVTIVGSLAGLLVGSTLSKRSISPGTATAVNLGSLWGTWFGFGAGVLAGQEDDALLAASLIGGNAGLLGTALLAPGWNVTRSRARLVSIAGVMGGVVGLGIDLLVQPEDEKAAIAIPLSTSAAGLLVGVAATGDSDDSGASPDQMGDALLNLAGGTWRIGMPIPVPVRAAVADSRGHRYRTRLAIPLLKGAF
jgi:hypothetical protein